MLAKTEEFTFMKKKLNLLIILSFILISGCMVNPVTLEREFNIVSKEKELKIGRNAHPQIIRQFGYYYDTAFQQFVNEIGKIRSKSADTGT